MINKRVTLCYSFYCRFKHYYKNKNEDNKIDVG